MKLIYIGNGAAFPDIPARDLTEEECRKLDVQFLIQSGLYKSAESEDKKSKRSETAKADGGN
jgi:hypothetical protein